MNKNSFLDYYKTILEKVSFDRRLFSKEYSKAKQMLGASESRELDYWLKSKGLTQQLEAVSSQRTGAWGFSRQQKANNASAQTENSRSRLRQSS
ncbi:hypothetical protein SAMN04489724_3361 [Algoriphagus locisalis]|uniref:Uncharacterized protein n=1 Tax=Algoriphagus locisalis TaxID=305507 RepID=A0A1I7CRK3_9BACT|nr:hypothetical protein [Algoriphagus locisalis]SFU02081.1 hypothetical protein SAMN04489724_3361 [Algoriphagus locisalis]